MKKITFILMLWLSLGLVKASVIIDETFNYSASNLSGESTWTTTGTLTTGTGRNIENSALTYSNSGGSYVFSGIGKKINHDYSAGTNYIAYRSFSSISSGDVYLSFLYQANGDQGQTASEVVGLSYLTTNSTIKMWVGKQADGTKNPFRFGLTRSSTSSADIVWSTDTYNSSTVYLIVIKYNLSTYAATMYINPVVGTSTEPTPNITAATDGTTRTSVNCLMFKHSGSSIAKFFVSGVRVSTSWTEAVAGQSSASPLPAPVNGSASSVTASGFTANWTPVDNATGYDVKVYMGANLIKTVSASGQATSSLVVSGVMSGITYSYKVVAKGDGTNFGDSEESNPSASVTTSDPYASATLNTDFGDGTWGTPVETQPASGSYTSGSFNGFDLNAAVLYSGSVKGLKGETHINRIAIDKGANSGMVTFPTVNSVEQIEIHATAGTAGNGFILKEFNTTTNTWDAIGSIRTYDAATKTAGTDSIYIIPVSRTVPAKFRIENASSGGIYLLQIITRTTNPQLLSKPLVGTATDVDETSYTANWTPVANATAYDIRTYRGTTLVSTIRVNGQSTASTSITGLSANNSYSYRVQAIGNNDIDFSDSFLSFSSASHTCISGNVSAADLSNLTSSSTIIIPAAAKLTVNANTTVKAINAAPGAQLTLSAGYTLTADNIKLESDATGTATYVDENSTASLISGTVQQHLTHGRNWYVSAPVSGATASALSTATSVVYYNEPTAQWLSAATTDGLSVLQGYISAATGSDAAISFSGILNNGEKTAQLTRTNALEKSGFNLVGNPYPSYLNWELVYAASTNLKSTIWFRTQTNDATPAYVFDTYNALNQVGTNNNKAMAVNKYIPPTQGFWVRVNDGYTTGELLTNNSMRSHADAATNMLKANSSVNSKANIIRLVISDGIYSDETIITTHAKASNGYDEYDSQKMFNPDNTVPEIYTINQDEKLVINGLNNIEQELSIPLGFVAGKNSTYSIQASELSGFDGYTIYIKDKTLNITSEISGNQTYTFNSEAGDISNRFDILFKSGSATTGLGDDMETADLIEVTANNNGLKITNNGNMQANIRIINSNGSYVYSNSVNPGISNINTSLNSGIYIIEINYNANKSWKKIILNGK